MADGDSGTKTYTQDEVERMVEERTQGLRVNRDRALDDAKKAKAALAGYEGVDPDEFKRLKTEAEVAQRKAAEAAGDFKSLEQQLVTKYEKQVAAEKERSTRLQKALEAKLIDADAMNALAGVSDTPRLLLPHIRSRMQVVEQDGEFVARIVDERGNVRISANGQGTAPMSLSELVEEMRATKDYAPAFKGTGAKGGGAAGSTGGASLPGGVIPQGDNAAFIANLADIASGKVTVAG